jgi:transposase
VDIMAVKREIPHNIDHDIRVKLKKCKEAKALRRLIALNMYRQGKTNREIAEATGYHAQRITQLVTEVLNNGLDSILQDRRTSNNYRMTYTQEAEFLKQFEAMSEDGQLVTVAPILQKYEEATGKQSNTTSIYRLLKRHGWRKLKPRPKHPKAASKEEQSRQKKLISCWQEGVDIMQTARKLCWRLKMKLDSAGFLMRQAVGRHRKSGLVYPMRGIVNLGPSMV